MAMTPRGRVEAALRGEPVDFVPFTVYERKLPMCAVERQLRQDGLCIHERSPNVYVTHQVGITNRSFSNADSGEHLTTTVFHTPAGDLTRVTKPMGWTTWTKEHLFKTPEDYPALRALYSSWRHEPAYGPFLRMRERWGDDAFVRATIGYTPLQQLVYHVFGPMAFGLEWAERRDEVMALYDILTEKRRELYPIVAESPAVAVNVCGNLSPQIIGRERFEQFVLPHLEETCAALQPNGILVGSHLDDNHRLWADLIGSSSLDYIEAFTPPPDCDLSVAEARALWPGKVLWINFPSSQHWNSAAEVGARTTELIAEAGDGLGFLVGVTEDVPDERWPETFPAILAACRAAGPRPG